MRNVVYIFIWFLLAFVAQVVSADLAVVWSERVDLYQHNRLSGILRFGDIVPVRKHKTDPEWILVKVGKGIHSTRAKFFRSQRQLAHDFHQEKMVLENKDRALADLVEANNARANELHACILQVQWDRAVFFRVPIPKSIDTVNDANNSSKHTHVHRPRYRRVEKISLSKARRLINSWRDQLNHLEVTNHQLIDKRFSIIQGIASKQTKFDQINSLFSKYKESPQTYKHDRYIVKSDTATLFDGSNRAGALKMGDIVVGERSPKDKNWLRILQTDEWYDSSAKLYKSRSDVELDHAQRIGQIRGRIYTIKEEINALELNESVLFSYIGELSRAANLSYKLVPLRKHTENNRIGVPPGEYSTEPPPGCIEVISRLHARRTIANWEDEHRMITRKLEERIVAVEALQERLATVEASSEKLKDRFNAMLY